MSTDERLRLMRTHVPERKHLIVPADKHDLPPACTSKGRYALLEIGERCDVNSRHDYALASAG